MLHFRRFHTSRLRLHDIVKISQPFSAGYTELPGNFRTGYDPLYVSPAGNSISLLKRASLGFGVAGLYISHLMSGMPLFSDSLVYLATTLSVIPFPAAHLLTQHYVTRLFRLYDTEKPQNLESLTTDETLVAEKVSFTGRRYYNTLVKVQDLQVIKNGLIKANWKTNDGLFYIVDDVGGIKMDRIWGVAEKNSGIDNGRYFGK